MAGFRYPNLEDAYSVNIRDGTLCRSASPRPGPVSPDPLAKRRSTLKILAFDGAKVHDFLFQVALAEIEWRDLDVNPQSALDAPVPKGRANERASMLYDTFLDSCSESPKAVTAFLAEQHKLQRQYLLKSQAIFESVGADYAKREVLFSRMLFGAHAMKSFATVDIEITGLFLNVPAMAGIALGYYLGVEFIKRIWPANEAYADAAVVGFKQTVANDILSVRGSVRLEHLKQTSKVLERTLRYAKRSSNYRSIVASAARIDALLGTLGVISALVTLYTEPREFWAALEQMKRTESTH